MLDDMRINDVELTPTDIRSLENADEVAHLFAQLGYNVDTRTTIPDIATLGLDSDDLRQQIRHLELLAVDPIDEDIKIYLFKVRSITAKLRNDIARRFRERPENALLVLTADYETLDFVLLERLVTKSKSRGKPLQQVIRPISLSINRSNPELVKLRVLKRFTFTEEDSAYQWEKLRSAYTLAEWSEEYFNNRALFSDYYLKKRLTDTQLTPEWKEDVHPAGREAYKHIISARKNFSGELEGKIRAGFYEPLFALLGFDFTITKASDSAADEPDYLLYAKNDRSQPIAVALTTVWNRNLDDVDTTREPEDGTPDEIPGALVISVLEKTKAAWVIVTNGKLWRLYSSTASNKATNYYEVDLEEAIAAKDQITALKYWWLMFRSQAFTGFLDTLLTESDKYAKELGERLKDDVFLRIFPQFAKGFITHMRAQALTPSPSPIASQGEGGVGWKNGEIDLDVVFTGTMTFLYRMMFILYAESLDLLPVSEEHGYSEYSLYALKRELTRVGDENETDAPDKLRKHYTTKSTAIYERLKLLFSGIDKGSADLNMPTYNGGLFSAENEAGVFLERYAIPDQFLMLGLDRLTRDEDSKTKKLVLIDFKSLGVRQLGSIYEGLLEFKLKIAAEALAVEKDGKRELYVPVKKAKKKEAAAAVAQGEVYLENDKQERKATGSYYTPDYIVKYIVQHTVGTVLERKFEELRPRLRTAQREYRDYAKLVEARRKSTGKDDSPLTFWNSDAMMQLVDDCLNVRVLDPAMGSGHFLVEVVDFVSNKLINFLNGWSENPVWAALDRTREDILADMERQHVTIDAGKLTRVALLKRAVLKRCVYGVDLNGMAVELAKVSLWLDAFTLGAPLSFLDHHLKWGNSLIGARVNEVQDYLRGPLGTGGVAQIDMFSTSEFAGVMLATDLMRQVSYLSDNTVAQVQASQTAFRDANDHLAPYKRLLDVYTSRWFDNQKIETGGAKAAKKAKTDYVRVFLREKEVQDWLKKPNTTALSDVLIPATTIAANALKSSTSKRFFHWELEFPEVFFAPSTPGGQDVKLREDGGFDAVVGNPPYIFIIEIPEVDRTFFEQTFQTCEYRFDLYGLFIEEAFRILRAGGQFGYIVPHSLLNNTSFTKIREYLIASSTSITAIDFSGSVFADASNEPMIIMSDKGHSNAVTLNAALVAPLESALTNTQLAIVSANLITQLPGKPFIVRGSEWLSKLLNGMGTEFTQLGWHILATQGLRTGNNPKFISNTQYNKNWRKIVGGSEIDRYIADWVDTYVLYDREILDAPRSDIYWSASEKIIVQEIRNVHLPTRIVAAFDTDGLIALNTTNAIILRDTSSLSLRFIKSILSSRLLNEFCRSCFVDNHIATQYIAALPVPKINFTTPADERERLTHSLIDLYTPSKRLQHLLQAVGHVMDSGKSDVIHDFLAHLAGQMIDLNKRKQAEVKRFLGWLEGKLKIAPKNGDGGIDSLPGKTILQGYLGDYQKGQPQVSWQDFTYRLHQNRNRFGVSLSNVEADIEREYAVSLESLLPIKDQLAKTDALIDKIVYQLYGLTDAEIELIERPQYEQALADAKADALKDETLTDDEQKLDKIAEGILPAAQRFFERIDPHEVETVLDGDLPRWRTLPPDAPTFLLTGDYNLRSLPDHMDFSSSVIPYSKAVEVTLHRLIFEPFRKNYLDSDCRNEFLQKFMRGEKELTLGSAMIILSSSSEKALRGFVGGIIRDVDGLATTLNDVPMRDVRNKAAHDEVVNRDEAGQARAWAFTILGMV